MDVVKFINETTNNKEKISKDKLKNSVNSTLFDKLKNNEEKYGFSEPIQSKKENKKSRKKTFKKGKYFKKSK